MTISDPLMCACGHGASEHLFSMQLFDLQAGIKTRGCRPDCDCTQFRTPPVVSGKRYDVLDDNGDILDSDDSWTLAQIKLRDWRDSQSHGSVRDNMPELDS